MARLMTSQEYEQGRNKCHGKLRKTDLKLNCENEQQSYYPLRYKQRNKQRIAYIEDPTPGLPSSSEVPRRSSKLISSFFRLCFLSLAHTTLTLLTQLSTSSPLCHPSQLEHPVFPVVLPGTHWTFNKQNKIQGELQQKSFSKHYTIMMKANDNQKAKLYSCTF